MRVLWLTEHYPPSRGGMAESCDRIVRGLRAAGVDLDVAHLAPRPRSFDVRREQGGRLITVPLEDNPEHALRRLWTELSRPAGDYTRVVAFGGTHALVAAPVLAAWLGAPLVTLLRGNDFDTGVFSLRRRGALLDALRASETVCVVARSHAPLVTALAPGVRTAWVTNSIEPGDWRILPSERAAAAGLRAAGRRTLGLIGLLKTKKGTGLLLDALRDSGRADAFHLLVAGEIEDRVEARLDGFSCTRLPFRDRLELPAVYAACDLVALPSFYDGLPNVALEAAALGVPLLASDAGGLADLADDEIGFTFAAGDPHGCRLAVERAAAASDAELAKLGEAARERVLRDFTPAAETAGYLAILR